MNTGTNFYCRCFDSNGNQIQVYCFSDRRSIHLTTDRLWLLSGKKKLKNGQVRSPFLRVHCNNSQQHNRTNDADDDPDDGSAAETS